LDEINYFNLLFGISILIATLLFLRYELGEFKKIKKGDSFMYYFYIKIFTGILAGILLGAITVYRELKHLF